MTDEKYVITGEEVEMLSKLLGYDSQTLRWVKDRPLSAELQKAHKTYESCHKKYSCPNGEECWYSSADYYWDCGEGATRLSKELKAERERVLAKVDGVVKKCACIDDNNQYYCWVEDLECALYQLRGEQP